MARASQRKGRGCAGRRQQDADDEHQDGRGPPGVSAPSRRGRAVAVLIAAARGSRPERAGDRDARPGPSHWSAANEPGEDGIRVNGICPGGMYGVTAILLACVMNTPRPATMTAPIRSIAAPGAAAAAAGGLR